MLMKKTSFVSATIAAAVAAFPLHADTTQTGPNTYEIDAGVSFTIVNQGASDWLWSWTDASGTFTNIPDPTLVLTAGETYLFDNVAFTHPFAITDDTLPVGGTDGSYFRNTTDFGVINDAVLSPTADFIDDPAPAIDSITWSPTNDELGIYYYTCMITFHLGMTGKFEIVAGALSCPADLTHDGVLNFFDVSAFLSAFAAMDPVADFNDDGQFNFFDVSTFLTAFADGCP